MMTSQHSDSAVDFFGAAGFELWNTGGNCEAFACRLDDGETYVLITDEHGERLPFEGGSIRVGIYNESKFPDGHYEDATSFADAVEKANALIDRHVA